MTLTIRRVAPTDLGALAELESELAGRLVTQDEIDRGMAPAGMIWLVAERAGRLIGRVRTNPPATAGMPPDDVPCHTYVTPAERRQGVGSALLEALVEALREQRPARLRAYGSEAEPAVTTWAVRQGFRVTHRHLSQSLDLARFDRAAWAEQVRGAGAKGFRFVAFPEVQTPDKERRMYDLFSRFLLETPDSDEHGAVPYEDWREAFVEGPGAWPAGWTVGLAPDGTWLGMTMIQRRAETAGHVLITGILPSYRGLGLSLALKAASIERAAAAGLTRLTTLNHAANEPILAANRRLGFLPGAITCSLVRPCSW